MYTTVETPRAQPAPLPTTYDELVALPRFRSTIVSALLGGKVPGSDSGKSVDPIPVGAIVYGNRRETAELYEPGIREFAWHDVSQAIRVDAANGDELSKRALITQYSALIDKFRGKFRQHLADLRNQPIGIGKLTFAQTHKAYEDVLKGIVTEIVTEHENGTERKLPACALEALKTGQITVVEDLEAFLFNHLPEFFAEVYNTDVAVLQKMSRKEIESLVHMSSSYVVDKFDAAQGKFLKQLAPSLFANGDIKALEGKLNQRKKDAIAQISGVVKIVIELQHQISDLAEVNLLDVMSDLETKSIWQLVEIVFYENDFGVGRVRRYWAQLILALTEVLHTIREDSHYETAEELTNRLNNLLTTRALDPEPGRAGKPVKGVFIDARGNYFEEPAEGRKPVNGLSAVKLKPLESVKMEDKKKRDLFPNGLWVICKSRAKKLEEIARKSWARGGVKMDEINDLAGLQFVIPPQQFIDEYACAHDGAVPSKEWLDSKLAEAAIELEYYLRDLWGVEELTEPATRQIGTAHQGSSDNAATAATFQVNKFVFLKTVRGVNIRAEAQILTLAGYLKTISVDAPESHAKYNKQRILKNILSTFLPPEIWPGFVEKLHAKVLANTERANSLAADIGA